MPLCQELTDIGSPPKMLSDPQVVFSHGIREALRSVETGRYGSALSPS